MDRRAQSNPLVREDELAVLAAENDGDKGMPAIKNSSHIELVPGFFEPTGGT